MPASSRLTSAPRASSALAQATPAGPEPITITTAQLPRKDGPEGSGWLRDRSPRRALRAPCHRQKSVWLREPLAVKLQAPMNQRTIEEFGEQWSRFDDLGGAFGSVEVLRDLCGPLLSLGEIGGRQVVEIGSGNGRIVNMLLDAGAKHVYAV